MAKTIVGDNLVKERGAFTFPHSGGEEFKETPFVYCTNLIPKVTDVVEQHRQVFIIIHVVSPGMMVPSQQTSYGHSLEETRTFKFNFQVMNTQHPNSQKNTTLLSIFKAGDSITNLHTALDMYKTPITEMQGMKLKYATII